MAPDALSRTTIGRTDYVLESVAPGVSALRLILAGVPSQYPVNVKRYLPVLLGAAITLDRTLRGTEDIPELDPRWKKNPAGCKNSLPVPNTGITSSWVHHGDLTVENAFLDGERVAFIDWEHALKGAPSIYDVFCLLLSILPAIDSPSIRELPDFRDRLPLQFQVAFFSNSEWGRTFQQALQEGFESLDEPAECWYGEVITSLRIRAHYHSSRGSGHTPAYRKMVDLACELQNSFMVSCIGRTRTGQQVAGFNV
jgi:hypothetical protein